ncbi:MAG: hypothetical protein K6G28_05760 [Acholeplasmatales bacterium]|nr:hypothetical protein [Acholeplasmatales bacterium]
MEYKFFKRTSFYFLLLCFAVSVFYFACPAKISLTFSYYLALTVIIITALVKFSMLNKDLYSQRDYLLDLSESVVSAIIAVICINFGQEYFVLSIICGVLYLIFPVVRLILAEIKINQLFLDSFKFLCGFVIMASNYHYAFWIKYILGTVFFVTAVTILITKFKHLKESREGSFFYE